MNTDNISPAQRQQALRDLLELRVPVNMATGALARFGWDSEQELVTLTRADATRTLTRYLTGELSADDVEQWADALEVREDVGREPGFGDELTELLFQLATPEVAGKITPETAKHWINTLAQ
jgi:hypothetical protein